MSDRPTKLCIEEEQPIKLVIEDGPRQGGEDDGIATERESPILEICDDDDFDDDDFDDDDFDDELDDEEGKRGGEGCKVFSSREKRGIGDI